MAEDAAVGVEDFRFRDEAYVFAVVYYGEIPGVGLVEDVHYFLHRHRDIYARRWRRHEPRDVHFLVEVRTEHDVAYVVEQHDSEQSAVLVGDGKEIAARRGYDVYHLLQIHLGVNLLEILLDHIVDLEKGQYRLVLLMREKVALLGKTHGVDAVRLEEADCHVGERRHDEQRQEEIIAAGHLRREEDCHKRGMHDTAHQTCHTHEGEILVGEPDFGKEIVEGVGEEESRERPDEKRGGEGAAHTARAVGGTRGEDLGEDYRPDEGGEKPTYPPPGESLWPRNPRRRAAGRGKSDRQG